MVVNVVLIHLIFIVFSLVFGASFESRFSNWVRVVIYSLYTYIFFTMTPIVIYKWISFNAVDLSYLCFSTLILAVFLLLTCNMHKRLKVEHDLLFLLSGFVVIIKSSILYYTSIIFLLMIFFTWILESLNKKDLLNFKLYMGMIGSLFLSFIFAYFHGDQLYLQSIHGSSSYWSTLFLFVFLLLLIFSMESIFTLALENTTISTTIIMSFLLVYAPIIFKTSLLFIHSISTLSELRHGLQLATLITLCSFGGLLYVISLAREELYIPRFLHYNLSILLFMGTSIFMYGVASEGLFLRLFYYSTLLQIFFLYYSESVNEDGLPLLLLSILYCVFPLSPLFFISIKYIELLYKFAPSSVIIIVLLFMGLIFYVSVEVFSSLKSKRLLQPRKKWSYLLHLLLLIGGYVVFIYE